MGALVERCRARVRRAGWIAAAHLWDLGAEGGDKLESVRLEEGATRGGSRHDLGLDVRREKVADVHQGVDSGGALGAGGAPHRERHHQVDGAVLRLPQVGRVRTVLRSGAARALACNLRAKTKEAGFKRFQAAPSVTRGHTRITWARAATDIEDLSLHHRHRKRGASTVGRVKAMQRRGL